MKRTDFRPNEAHHTYEHKEYPANTNRGVVQRFLDGKSAHSTNGNMHTDGKVLYSYNTAIAKREDDGRIIVNNTKYSTTTSGKHQNPLMAELHQQDIKYDVTGGKPRGYEFKDFEKE